MKLFSNNKFPIFPIYSIFQIYYRFKINGELTDWCGSLSCHCCCCQPPHAKKWWVLWWRRRRRCHDDDDDYLPFHQRFSRSPSRQFERRFILSLPSSSFVRLFVPYVVRLVFVSLLYVQKNEDTWLTTRVCGNGEVTRSTAWPVNS